MINKAGVTNRVEVSKSNIIKVIINEIVNIVVVTYMLEYCELGWERSTSGIDGNTNINSY